MADTVKDQNANIMNLVIRQVEGIDEPVKLVSPMGFAVGSASNRVFAWGISYEQPANDAEADEQEGAQQERLDGVQEESKTNVAQLVQDPTLVLTQAFAVPFDFEVDPSVEIVDVKSSMMQTCFLTSKGAVYSLDHKNGFVPD